MKHRDLGRLPKGLHSEKGVLASLEGSVWGGGGGKCVRKRQKEEKWMEYSGGNGRLESEAEHLDVKIVYMLVVFYNKEDTIQTSKI